MKPIRLHSIAGHVLKNIQALAIKMCGWLGMAWVLGLYTGSLYAAELYPLHGQWRFQAGDQPQWADSAYQDQHWSPVTIGRSLQLQGVSRPQTSIGWYRLSFRLPPLSDQTSGANRSLWLGRVMEADEVFLNGVRLGGEGRIGRSLPESIAAYSKVRVYPLPPGVLRPDDDNVLAVRVQGYFLQHGLIDKNILIGDALELTQKADRQERRYLFYETALLACLLLLLLLGTALQLILPTGDGELNALRLFTTLLLVSLSTESLGLYVSGYKGTWATIAGNIAYALMPIPIIRYGQSLFKLQRRRHWRLIKYAVAGLALATVVPLNHVWVQTVATFSYLIWLISGLYLALIALSPAWRQQPGGQATALGFALLLGGTISLLVTVFTLTFWPVVVSLLAFTLCILVAYSQKLAYLMRRFRSMSEQMADTVEEERRRLSRDLHDTLGQQLALLQFRLKLTQQQQPELDLAHEIQLVSDGIYDLRRVIHDQRPLILEQQDNFTEVLKHEISRINLTGVFTVDLRIEVDQICLPQSVAQHIFRIVQECLHNAHHHGEADCVTLSLRQQDDRLTLSITDDGTGFAPNADHGPGMGLINMRDRSRLINATLSVRRRQPRGTCVELLVPCQKPGNSLS